MAMSSLRLQGLFFSVVALVVTGVSVLRIPIDPQLELLWTGLLIVFLGVPHGALDPVYAEALPLIKSRIAWVGFVVCYLLLALLVVAVWWYAPSPFLVGFLLVSAWHFSGDLGVGATFLLRFFYGGAVIVLPAAFHAAELNRLFSLLAGPQAAALIMVPLQFMAWPWLVIVVCLVASNARHNGLLVLELMALSLLTLCVSPLLAFTVYFCCMHSPRHIMRTQQYAGMSFKRLALVAVLPMLAVMVMAAGSWYLLPDSAIDERMLQFLYVALAALTIPHMVLVERVRFTEWQPRTVA
jgi:Brp/Blh family beta-carotene 15,15'-monooxygenase